MNCKSCGREPKWFWKDKSKQNGHSECFYTYKGKEGYCLNCIELLQGSKPTTLQDLNNQRKNEKK